MSRSASPLSSVNGETSDVSDHEATESFSFRPAKRQKVGEDSATSSTAVHEPEADAEAHAVPETDLLDGMSDVSEDTDGDIPSSPISARFDEDDFQEQVTLCQWDGCNEPDFHSMDSLVKHIHTDHIDARAKQYTCEWNGCNRKSMAHASGYALKAHMRSHTREKPFYCYLPECDRAFTRSDALAKHMRTVHETEALRPSDPVPKSMQQALPTGKSKLKIIIKTPQSHATGLDGSLDGGEDDGELSADLLTPLTSEQGFTTEELDMPLQRLYKLCHFQVQWAKDESKKLHEEIKHWEAEYKKQWLEKEVLLSQLIQSERDWHDRRQAVLSGAADVRLAGVLESQETNADADADAAGEDHPMPISNGSDAAVKS
ncbi:zinc finger protein [Plectosphaerella plurivora]|uniref:Zinc finger protein n=1 Tax=Plectosphaerella plurivora TaxID=936078 RepID=A0A9P8V9H0_9PEZI|nr:zinc finger protein [Plectosphaerella plurivora]